MFSLRKSYCVPRTYENKHTCDVNSGNKIKTTEIVSSLDISLDDVDWNEPFEEISDSNTQDFIQDSVNVNWNDDVFSEMNTISTLSVQREDNYCNEFEGNYNFSKEMLEVLHIKFGLESFRPGQREIITAILSKHDCFVLMPTGGGKSLCFQVPAILSKGVTVVISPLIALMCDQVDKLNALDIRAAHLCSTVSRNDSDEILSRLYLSDPEIDLLYLTPEKICISKEIGEVLDSLYNRGKLVRFVMDEVHCLSLWGHDFRPHYKELSMLREKYNDIQIVCFTATATKQVETDVIINLKLRNVQKFIQSFNRPNIKYQVIDKLERVPIFQIARLINKKFFRQCGIIYCLTRKDCVILSQYLRHLGIAAKPYHAGLEDKVRENTQREWMQDQFHVVVATVAFGMGIDKPDVRFVIHNTIPKSLEAYYQETGRAGRDGEISYSYLFYNYDDVLRTIKLMSRDFTKTDTLDGHFDNLEQMVAFANNQIDCRRYLQLLNLGEDFDRQICIQNKETTCDNCENFDNHILNEIDITRQAKELSILVQDITNKNNVTLNTVAKIYKGSKESCIRNKGFHNHKFYGTGRLMSRLDVHRILRNLIIKNVLANQYITTGEFPIVYIKPGAELQTFLNSVDMKMNIPVANNRSALTEYFQTENSTSEVAVEFLTNKIKTCCHQALLDLCHKLALAKNVSPSSILHPSAVKSISEILPRTREELLKIQHVTIATFNKFGEQILHITNQFKEQILSLQGETMSGCKESTKSNTVSSHSIPLKRRRNDN